MTSGQLQALNQIEEIARTEPHPLHVEEIGKPTPTKPWLRVTVSILIGQIPMAKDGLQFRDREVFHLLIPTAFPFRKPEVWVPHERFAGKPHVQWKYHLCLYQSSTEWNPSDGMFGFIDRISDWIQQGAINQLDPDGAPLHPPVVYSDQKKGKLIVPRVDAPNFSSPYWIGVTQMLELPTRIELTAWHEIRSLPEQGQCALALLFASPLPWEYPAQGAALFSECERHGVPQEGLFHLLKAASFLTKIGQPIYLILGSPMRGIAGEIRKQHLSVWAINPETADSIRNTCAQSLDNLGISAIREKLEHLLVKFLKDSTISWCPVMEARPEVTIRRDSHTHLSFFEEKSVSIWGCGALGAHIAVYLCRAGVRKLTLRDHGLVTPGILVRQPYTYRDIGKQKVEALKEKLLSINPDLEISEYYSDIVYELGKPDFVWSDGADVVIDATASQLVRMRLETVWNSANQPHIPVASLMVDQTATHLMTGIAQGHFSGATWDLFRKAKLELLRDSMYLPFADSFFPNGDDIRKPFQPEPGCSEPTFIGSSADSAGLAGIGLNLIATAVSTDSPGGTVQFFSQNSNQSRLPAPTIFTFKSDMIFYATPYTVRISPDALSELCAVINQNRRIRGKNIETGGLIWGEWDDGMQVVWISNVSGPPQDSFQSENSFRCGREGTSEEHRIRQDWSRLSVGYLGMWHTHPNSQPFPSPTDEHGMAEILSSGPLPPRKQALLITGIISGETYLGCYLFERTSLKICLIGKEIQPFPNVKL